MSVRSMNTSNYQSYSFKSLTVTSGSRSKLINSETDLTFKQHPVSLNATMDHNQTILNLDGTNSKDQHVSQVMQIYFN